MVCSCNGQLCYARRLTGIRYDAVDKILYIDSRIGDDFTSFLSTETGFGNVGLKEGKPFIDVKYGGNRCTEMYRFR